MIQMKIVTGTMRKTITTDENNTVRQVLENNEVNYATTPVYLDGTSLTAGQHDKSFKELGITEKCILSAVQKLDNAR